MTDINSCPQDYGYHNNAVEMHYIPPSKTTTSGTDIDDLLALGDDSHLQRRCQSCGLFYLEKHNSPKACVYHPGHFRYPPDSVAMMRWSCCQGYEKGDRGCHVAPHAYDPDTSAVLSRFQSLVEKGETGAVYDQLAVTDVAMDTASKTEAPSEKMPEAITTCEVGPSIYRHKVQMTDTLPGLALKYGVLATDIKRANKLMSDAIISRKELIIPNPKIVPEDLVMIAQKDYSGNLIKVFQRETGCTSVSEARFYLDDYQNDLTKAAAAYRADLHWEESSGPTAKPAFAALTVGGK